MPFKFNISAKDGKTYKLEAEALDIIQKSIGDKISGAEISPDLAGYELQITGASDTAGLPSLATEDGIALRKVLLGYGKCMHNRPKGLTKKGKCNLKGLRMRRTVRGKIISQAMAQINTKVVKEGHKKLKDIFPEQNKSDVAPQQEEAEQAAQSEETKAKETELAHPKKEPKEKLPPKQEKVE